jgi:hypothetical protein
MLLTTSSGTIAAESSLLLLLYVLVERSAFPPFSSSISALRSGGNHKASSNHHHYQNKCCFPFTTRLRSTRISLFPLLFFFHLYLGSGAAAFSFRSESYILIAGHPSLLSHLEGESKRGGGTGSGSISVSALVAFPHHSLWSLRILSVSFMGSALLTRVLWRFEAAMVHRAGTWRSVGDAAASSSSSFYFFF